MSPLSALARAWPPHAGMLDRAYCLVFSPHTLETWRHLPMKTKFHAGVPSRAFSSSNRASPSLFPMSRSHINTHFCLSSLGATLWVARFGLPLERGGVESFHPPLLHLLEREREMEMARHGMGMCMHGQLCM